MYELLGISLVLAALLAVNALASLAVAGCWRWLSHQTHSWSAQTRANLLFFIRIAPPAAALVFVVFFLIPSYLVYEPTSTSEVVSRKLAALALVSAAGIVLAGWRSIRSWLATRSLLRQWLAASEKLSLAQTDIPAFRIRHPFPIIAVVGALRPRLFVADQVLETLGEEELAAALAHETGHLRARDNLKRTLMRVCRDALAIAPLGGSIDRDWSVNAESAADEYAANRGSAVALNLASALIKIARMAPAGRRPTTPVATFLLGDETDGLMGRVSRLIRLAAGEISPEPLTQVIWLKRIVVLAVIPAVGVALAGSNALALLHGAMERIVQILT